VFLVQGSSPPLASLTDTLGIDIAGRLRSHFLANLPSQSYAWLNSMSGAAPPHPHPLGGGRSSERHSSGGAADAAKLEKHPLGGIRSVRKNFPFSGILLRAVLWIRITLMRFPPGCGSGIRRITLRVADPDPNWIRIQSAQWIRIRIRNPVSTKIQIIEVMLSDGITVSADTVYKSTGITGGQLTNHAVSYGMVLSRKYWKCSVANSGMNIPDHISESLETICCVNILFIL
jgi:hypothetical protein